MSVQKKSLISNHQATRKAIIATKPPSTNFSSSQPLATKPIVTKPMVTKPMVTKPMVTKQMVTKPVVSKVVFAGKII
jgi:hypothetical protein